MKRRRSLRPIASAATVVVASIDALGLAPSHAGLRSPAPFDPVNCSVEVSGQTESCQFRFHPAGELSPNGDVLLVHVALRDPFEVPVPACSTTVTLVPIGVDTHNFCTCCGEIQSAFSDSAGTLLVTWDRIGGFGTLTVRVTMHCYGDIPLADIPIDFTSSDLTGTCNESSTPADIHDIALWARGLSPEEWIRSDWDCDGGSADIHDAAEFVHGLFEECADGGPCP
jgi:hypothetical protein